MPKTKLGKWAVYLIIAMPVLFVLGSTLFSFLYQSAPVSNTLLEDLKNRPGLSLAMLGGMGCGVAAFITGIIALTKQKDRSPTVWVAVVVGALLILFLVGEFAFPH